MIKRVYTATSIGIEAVEVLVEIDAAKGIPSETIIGLPDTVIRESKNRIKSAIKESNFAYKLNAYTINLSPAQLPKEGPSFDLPIAIGILSATKQIEVGNDFFAGELLLDGTVKGIKGILSICELAKQKNYDKIFIPKENIPEITILQNTTVYPIEHLSELHNTDTIQPYRTSGLLPSTPITPNHELSDVYGQYQAKRALLIALSGHHNLLLVGPPGCGKTMLMNTIPSLLPPLSHHQAIETSKIHSLSSLSSQNILATKPFRKPHHSLSSIGMVGGGKKPQPGEISLAHNGVLFLDELSEFNKGCLEALRQPLEDKQVHISRVGYSTTFPANFLLVATMNPCPCGYHKDSTLNCICSESVISRYWKKISGPILDRFDITLEIPRLKKKDYSTSYKRTETTTYIRKKIIDCQKLQQERQENCLNGDLTVKTLNEHCKLSENLRAFLSSAVDKGKLTARGVSKILKVSRTIADLEDSTDILEHHLFEAMQFKAFSP